MSAPVPPTGVVVLEARLPTAAYALSGLGTLALGIMVLVWPGRTLALMACSAST